MNAEIMALKNFVKDETNSLNKNIDRVKAEMYNQTNFMERIEKMLEEGETKTEIIKSLSKNLSTITNACGVISKNQE